MRADFAYPHSDDDNPCLSSAGSILGSRSTTPRATDVTRRDEEEHDFVAFPDDSDPDSDLEDDPLSVNNLIAAVEARCQPKLAEQEENEGGDGNGAQYEKVAQAIEGNEFGEHKVDEEKNDKNKGEDTAADVAALTSDRALLRQQKELAKVLNPKRTAPESLCYETAISETEREKECIKFRDLFVQRMAMKQQALQNAESSEEITNVSDRCKYKDLPKRLPRSNHQEPEEQQITSAHHGQDDYNEYNISDLDEEELGALVRSLDDVDIEALVASSSANMLLRDQVNRQTKTRAEIEEEVGGSRPPSVTTYTSDEGGYAGTNEDTDGDENEDPALTTKDSEDPMELEAGKETEAGEETEAIDGQKDSTSCAEDKPDEVIGGVATKSEHEEVQTSGGRDTALVSEPEEGTTKKRKRPAIPFKLPVDANVIDLLSESEDEGQISETKSNSPPFPREHVTLEEEVEWAVYGRIFEMAKFAYNVVLRDAILESCKVLHCYLHEPSPKELHHLSQDRTRGRKGKTQPKVTDGIGKDPKTFAKLLKEGPRHQTAVITKEQSAKRRAGAAKGGKRAADKRQRNSDTANGSNKRICLHNGDYAVPEAMPRASSREFVMRLFEQMIPTPSNAGRNISTSDTPLQTSSLDLDSLYILSLDKVIRNRGVVNSEVHHVSIAQVVETVYFARALFSSSYQHGDSDSPYISTPPAFNNISEQDVPSLSFILNTPCNFIMTKEALVTWEKLLLFVFNVDSFEEIDMNHEYNSRRGSFNLFLTEVILEVSQRWAAMTPAEKGTHARNEVRNEVRNERYEDAQKLKEKRKETEKEREKEKEKQKGKEKENEKQKEGVAG